jgi:Animal haem peroxidase
MLHYGRLLFVINASPGILLMRKQRKVPALCKVKLSLDALEDRCLPSVAPIYYSYDGTNNNLTHPTWGSGDTDLLRSAGTAYADGISAPAGPVRPDARQISNVLER